MALPDGRVLFVNAAGRRTVGLDPGEDVGRLGMFDFVVGAEGERMREEILPRVWRYGRWEGEMVFRNFRTGGAVPMWQHIFFLTEEGTNQRVLATISRDLSERRQAAEKMEAAQAQIMHMARVTTMGELTAAIAHEVNQPLAAVVTNANACVRWLGGERPDLEEARAAAVRIAAEGRRASEVLGRIRTLMKKGPARSEALDLREMISQVLELVRPHILRNGVLLRTEVPAELPSVAGDAVQLQQVLLNLMMNAIEATADNPRGERIVTVSCVGDGEVRVAVRDTGVGIDAAHVDQLFAPFYTTKTEGMGMGLSISRSIIEAHGGRLRALANQGAGATFEFSIPVRTAG